MSRQYINLEQIAEFSNLVLAFHKAARGKRYRKDVQAFSWRFNDNISGLGNVIRKGKMPYGRFRAFTIYDPKQRTIHAACFEDRIFHHAVMNVAGETLEKAMSPFSYACRPEKGVHKAMTQVQKNLQRFGHYVKIDIAGYFSAIDHDVLLAVLSKRYKGNAFLKQLERIVSSHHVAEKVGLPIGSLTSQYFANYYLDALDRKLETDTNIHAYVRYMDDIIWWCSDKETAKQSLRDIKSLLWQQRKLTVKSSCQVQSSKRGVTYCGFRVSQGAVRLTTRKKQRFQARRQYWESLYQQGKIDALQLQRAYASVHAITAKTDSLSWRRENLKRHPGIEV